METLEWLGITIGVLGMCIIALGLWDLALVIKSLQDTK